jgi:hypothetical protein
MEVCVSVSKGRECVEHFAEICGHLGYSVYVPDRETHLPWDAEINGFRSQVKFRSRSTNRNSSPHVAKLKTYLTSAAIAYSRTDFDVLAMCFDDIWHVIPVHALNGSSQGIVNYLYMPKFSSWADRWDVLDGERVVYAQQKCFDF